MRGLKLLTCPQVENVEEEEEKANVLVICSPFALNDQFQINVALGKFFLEANDNEEKDVVDSMVF